MSFSEIVFLLGFIAGCGLALIRHPIFGLITYVAVFYLHPPARWWGQGMLHDIRWAFLAAGITLIAMFLHRKSLASSVALRRSGLIWGFLLFVAWIALQSSWALDPVAHSELLTIYLKFILVFAMVGKCITSEKELRLFLWAHVLGCFYLGWLAFTSYEGGRFEGFGSPGILDANAAALQIVTGIVAAGALFLSSHVRAKAALLAVIPFIVNALVTTVSRGGFLAVAAAGLVYNVFAPKKYRFRVHVFSVLAVVLFTMLTTDNYWGRMDTIKLRGADIEGVDTGGGRLEIIAAQWEMAKDRPLGCGHMCTTVLSPLFIEERFRSGGEDRASHNTFMTMLVDHGVVGVIAYVALFSWIVRSAWKVFRRLKGQAGFLSVVAPAVVSILAAIVAADMFAQYPKFEARIWFLGVLMVLVHITRDEPVTVTAHDAPRSGSIRGALPAQGG